MDSWSQPTGETTLALARAETIDGCRITMRQTHRDTNIPLAGRPMLQSRSVRAGGTQGGDNGFASNQHHRDVT